MTVGTETPKPAESAPAPAAASAPATPVVPASAPPVPAATTAPAAVTPPAPASPVPAATDAPRSLLADDKVEAKTGEATPAGEAPKTGEAAPAPAAEELKLEAPKDSPLAAATVEKLTAWAKDAKIPKAEAQKLVEALHAESVAGQAAAKAKADSDYSALYKTWGDELKADKEVGGEKLADSLAQAKRTLRLFATPQERAFLEQTPFGNHPVLVKILARAGAKMSEDGFIGGAGNPPAPKTPAQTIYGSDHAKPSSFR